MTTGKVPVEAALFTVKLILFIEGEGLFAVIEVTFVDPCARLKPIIESLVVLFIL